VRWATRFFPTGFSLYGKTIYGEWRSEVARMRSRAGFETGLHATVTGGVKALELPDWSEVASFAVA
jgi:hypothetical protein